MLPLYVNVSDKKIVVFGGGTVAERKIRQIMDTRGTEGKPDLEVYSLEFTPWIEEQHENGELKCIPCDLWRADLGEHLKTAFFVLVCTNDEHLNTRILRDAAEFDVLVNYRYEGDVFMSSVINKCGFLISISTDGKGPAMAKYMREKISQFLDAKEEKMLLIQSRLRDYLKEIEIEETKRHEILNSVLHDPECWAALDAPLEIAEKVIRGIIGDKYE